MCGEFIDYIADGVALKVLQKLKSSNFYSTLWDGTDVAVPKKETMFQAFSSSSLHATAYDSPALFQNIFKFYTFLPKFSNILPFFALFKHFFALFLKNRTHAPTF